jgi:hypothetical protein
MADLSITAAQVDTDTTGQVETLIASVAVTAGQAVYKTNGSQAALADNDVDAATAKVYGVAVCDAAAGQSVTVQRTGSPTIGAGASITAGALYVLSSTAGGIAPEADLGTNDYVSIIGVGTSDNKIRLAIANTGIQHA